MAGEVVRVEGLDDLKRKLSDMGGTLRRRVLRNALAAAARDVRDTARRNAPVLTAAQALRNPHRKPGTVRKAISVRTSKADRREGNVGVFVNVRPAKSGARGAKNPNDPFYWRFLEFGTRRMAARPYLRPAADRLPQALSTFQSALAKWIAKVDSSGNPNSN